MQEIKLNLLPVEYRSNKGDLTWVLSRRFIWPIVLIIITIVAVGVYWATLMDEVNDLKAIGVSQKAKIKKLAPVKKKVKTLKSKLNKIKSKNKALEGIQFSKTKWILIFQDLSSILPLNSWIKSISESGKEGLKISATTYQFADIAQYMVDLENQKSFNGVKLLKIKTIQYEKSQAFSFDLSASIDPAIGLNDGKGK